MLIRMEYKLLKSYMKGILLTRQPEAVTDGDELYITFTGAPDGATAIFEGEDGYSLYRVLKDESCKIPSTFLLGTITVRVAVLNGTTSSPVYICEGIKATVTAAAIIVRPDDTNLPDTVREIQLNLQEIKDEMENFTKKYSELNTKLTKLLEGYDIT